MAYKMLTKVRGANVATPSVRINKNSIRISASARNAFGIDGYGFATMHQDDEQGNKLALRLTKEVGEHGKAIRAGAISAMEWIKPYNLPFGNFGVTFDESEALLEFDTDNGVALKSRKPVLKDVTRQKKVA